MSDDIGGVWRTVGGRRIFIKEGQSLSDAMSKSGKFKNKYKKYYTKKLNSIVIEKYVRTKAKNTYVFDENYWYFIENKSEGSYNIKTVLRIEGNEDFINELSKEIDSND